LNPEPGSFDVAVVGAGISGLAAAYELSLRGVSFVVLERGDRAGGVILSEQIDGFTIDGGPDSLLLQKPEAIRLCEELGIGDRLVPTKLPRLAYIQRGGRLHRLPTGSVLGIPTRIGSFVTSTLFSWRGKLRMGAEFFVPPRMTEGDESIGSFMTRRFGAEAKWYLAEPLLAGIHAGDVDRLSMHALFPRFVDEERRHGSLLKAFRAQSRTRVAVDGAFKSLPGGLTEMVDAIVSKLPPHSLRLGAGVTRIDGGGPFRLDAGGAPVDARSVIITTPAYIAADLLKERDSELARRCAEIPYASAVTVALAFRREDVSHPLNGSGFVVPRVESSRILAASWLSSKWPHRAPEGSVLMRAFLGGTRDPHALGRTDEVLVRQSLEALTPLLGIHGPPLFTRVYRWERANAQHEVGHLARVAAIDLALARHPGLLLTGSGFRGVGIPDCIADARATARQAVRNLET
jgi:oxygen-dependent protoporphyrinogen oxidase